MYKRYRNVKEFASGDIGFTYSPVVTNEVKFDLLLVTSFILLLLVRYTYQFVNHPLHFLWAIIPFCLIVYNYYTSNKDKENENIEAEAIEDILKPSTIEEIAKQIFQDDVFILYSRYVVRQTVAFGQYERYYYVALSNDQIIRFKVVIRKGEDKKSWNLTIRKKPEICNYEETVHFVVPFAKRIRKKISLDTPIIGIGFFLVLFLLLSACFILPCIYIPRLTLISIISWIIVNICLWGINKWVSFPNWVFTVLRFPSLLINLWYKLVAAFFAPLLGICILIVIGGLFSLIIYLAIISLSFGEICWKPDFAVFIGVSVTSILSVHFLGVSQWVMVKCGFFGVRETKSLEMPILGLTEYILQKENINAIIYLLYSILLFFTSIRLFILPTQDVPIWESCIDTAVTKAFVVHIAVTNMISKLNDSKFKIPKIHNYMKGILGMKK